MTDNGTDLQRCPACGGLGYHTCDCWPGDCICGHGDQTCEECRGEGSIDPTYDDDEDWEMRQTERDG